MSTTHHLVIALRPEHAAEAARVEHELRAMEGVSVTGAFRGRIQATASADALAAIRRKVEKIALVEEQVPRQLP
jgi:hypothetical protein